jgi:drug/metabolite transporter (DMT)-like permease
MPAVSTAQSHSQHPLFGIAFKLISVVCLACMAASVKYLGNAIPAGQAVFFRGLIALPVIVFIAWRGEGLQVLLTRNWRAHAARSLAGAISMFCWFTTLTMIPLAQMTAISFTIPLFLTVLAMLFLAERIHWYRWTALAVGFGGVLIIVLPELVGSAGNPAGVGLGFTAAILAAFALMFLRRMSGHEHVLTITFYFFLTSTALALVTALFGDWPVPAGRQWLVLLMVGIFGVAGQLTMSISYRYAEASLTAPLDYVTMLLAVAIGYFVFNEVPHLSTWLGAPLVIVAGIIIIWREYAKLKAFRSAPDIAAAP